MIARRAVGAGVAALLSAALPAQPTSAALKREEKSLSFYESQVPRWVGGYTVQGSAITNGGKAGVKIESFSVEQECLCAVKATPQGLYAQGANADNAFSLIAAKEPDGTWLAQQVSVGAKPQYQAQMRFLTSGGEHSAQGFFLAPPPKGEQTAFRADQSAIGCSEGVGAAACERVCKAQGLPWEQIRDRCDLFEH